MESIEITRIMLHFVCPNCKHSLTQSLATSLAGTGLPICCKCGTPGDRWWMRLKPRASIK